MSSFERTFEVANVTASQEPLKTQALGGRGATPAPGALSLFCKLLLTLVTRVASGQS